MAFIPNPKWLAVAALTAGLALSVAAQEKPKEDKKDKSDKPAAAAPAPEAPQAPTEGEYKLGANDVLTINVWKEPDFSTQAIVRSDGKITLNLLGDIQATGLTPAQLGESVTEKLKKYLSEPRVTVTVTQMNSQRIFVMGQVGRGGAFPLLPGTTIMQALSYAGGPNQNANPKKIYLLRKENGKETKYPFNYEQVLKGVHWEQNLQLKPGDTIVVP